MFAAAAALPLLFLKDNQKRDTIQLLALQNTDQWTGKVVAAREKTENLDVMGHVSDGSPISAGTASD